MIRHEQKKFKKNWVSSGAKLFGNKRILAPSNPKVLLPKQEKKNFKIRKDQNRRVHSLMCLSIKTFLSVLVKHFLSTNKFKVKLLFFKRFFSRFGFWKEDKPFGSLSTSQAKNKIFLFIIS